MLCITRCVTSHIWMSAIQINAQEVRTAQKEQGLGSSVVRASARQVEGPGFDPQLAHQNFYFLPLERSAF